MNLEILNINSTSATVKWERPRHNGTGNQISYLLTVTCERGCNHVISDIRTNQLSYKLENLKTHTNYNVTIYSVNNVTTATGQKRGTNIGFKTKSGRKYTGLIVRKCTFRKFKCTHLHLLFS